MTLEIFSPAESSEVVTGSMQRCPMQKSYSFHPTLRNNATMVATGLGIRSNCPPHLLSHRTSAPCLTARSLVAVQVLGGEEEHVAFSPVPTAKTLWQDNTLKVHQPPCN